MPLTNEQKIAFLNSITNEVFLIDEILIPMFTNMGRFKKVIKTHGPDEKGKDIVLMSKGDFNQNVYTGIIVKNEQITNASSKKNGKEIVATVSNQITMCINSGYDSTEEGKNISFSNIIVLTSKNISNSAKSAFVKIAESHKSAKLIFWEAQELIENIDSFLPDIYLVSHGVLSKYFHLLKERCESMNELKKITLYKGDEKKLSDVYIEPNVFKKGESISNGHTTPVYVSTTLGELIRKNGKYLISGSAGSGKSTLLRSEIYKLIINYETKKSNSIPVLIRIKDIVKNSDNLQNFESYIFEYLSKEYNLTKDEVKTIFDSKNDLIFFFDGFDELSTVDEKNKFYGILDIIETYPNNNIIVTSRKTKLFFEKFSSYSKWELSEFTLKQITNFIQKWFKERNEQLIADLKDHNLLDRLPNTPLVMTLIAILFESDENVEIPSNLSELYRMFVDLLIGRWNLDRKIDTFYKANDKEMFLTETALFLHNNNRISCTEDELMDVFNATAKKLGRKFENHRLLDELIKDTNLLLQNEREEYEFRHLSFQEYFVGTYLTIKNDTDKIIELFPHPWWDQVLYFYCGTRKINDDILPKIFDKIKICSDKNKILGLFELGYLIQSSYKTDAKIRGELILKSLITYSEIIPKFITEIHDEKRRMPEIIYYLSFMEAFKMHFGSKYLKEIYHTIYNEIKKQEYDTFEKALTLFLLVSIMSADGNIDVLADCDNIFKNYPELLLMEDFILRCELLEEIKDKEIKETIKEHSKKISKRIRTNKGFFKGLLE
jgi:hypothetical protein